MKGKSIKIISIDWKANKRNDLKTIIYPFRIANVKGKFVKTTPVIGYGNTKYLKTTITIKKLQKYHLTFYSHIQYCYEYLEINHSYVLSTQ